MLSLILAALSAIAGVSHAHTLTGSSLARPARKLVLPPLRNRHQPSAAEIHQRAHDLFTRPRVRKLFVANQRPSANDVRDEMVGGPAYEVARIEAALAARFGVAYARVSEETDFLIRLAARPELSVRARALLARRKTEPLGPEFVERLLTRFRLARLKPFRGSPPNEVYVRNLAGHLRDAYELARTVLADGGDARVEAFLTAPLPPRAAPDYELPAQKGRITATEREALGVAHRERVISRCIQLLTEN